MNVDALTIERALQQQAPELFTAAVVPAPVARLDVAPESALARARAYLGTIEPAIEGQGGDAATYRAACILVRDFGLAEADALNLLTEWNARCVPPWTLEELQAKVRNAARYGAHPPGAKLDGSGRSAGRPEPSHPADSANDAADQASPFVERFPQFAARMATCTAPDDIVPGLVPGQGITMIHGQPRDMKTLARQEITRATTTGDAAFGSEQFRVRAPVQTWVITEEDPEVLEHDRYLGFFAGRDQALPDTLHISVQKGIDLDDVDWQAHVRAYGKTHEIKLLVIDPVRASTAMADQGPRELKPFATFLRRLMRETGCAVLLVHHDTKPLVGKNDDRARPQRASGGGIFSIADSPIHAERLSGAKPPTLLTPALYKYAAAPDPFVVTLEADDPKRPTWMRMTAELTTAAEAAELVMHQKVADYLREHPGTSGSQLAKAIHARKDHVLGVLETLHERTLATFIKSGQAKLWSMLSQEVER